MTISKVCPVALRGTGRETEALVFTHPIAGVQFVKGTVEPEEPFEVAARRELLEESGLAGLDCLGALSSSHDIVAGQVWHFFLYSGEGLPEHWTHQCADDGGHAFLFFWHRLTDAADENWHESFVRTLAYLKAELATAWRR